MMKTSRMGKSVLFMAGADQNEAGRPWARELPRTPARIKKILGAPRGFIFSTLLGSM
jgi:hypothetical protein